jgi:glucose-1-phosphate adenylyltransferase
MERVLAMVLAGGRGTRMDILCHERPKPALPFAGGLRVIDFSLSNCVHSQIRRIAVLIDYQRSSMANYLRQWHLTNGPEDLSVLEPKAGSYLGTADAVYQNLNYLQRYNPEAVLVLAGDHVYKMDYRPMLAFHRQVNADVTIGVIPVPISQAHRFGIITTDSESRIIEFVEKPRNPQCNLASMGIYVFNPKVLAKRLSEDAAQPDSVHDFGHSIAPRMVKRDRVFAYRFNGYWQDIGTIDAYYEANIELTRELPSFTLNGAWPTLTYRDIGLPRARIFEHGNIQNSLISPGCVIKGHIENSVLSPGVWVEEQAVVRDSVLLTNTFVGYHSIVENCILDEGVNIGKFCYIGVGAAPTVTRGEITVLGNDVAVPAYTAIRRNCRILPHVKSAEFTGSRIPRCYNFSGKQASPASDGEKVTANEC